MSHRRETPAATGRRHSTRTAALTLGALGVVFGDIGTSPLYTMHEVFGGPRTFHPDPDRIYGVLSLIVWSLILIVTVKYVALIMRAGNNGEGGIMALIGVIKRSAISNPRVRYGLILLGIVGASLFYGDGVITPAISVLSAVEGLQVAAPGLSHLIVPLAVIIITALFLIQRFGTQVVGRVFGPIMTLWFVVLAALGVAQIIQAPGVLRSLSPTYAVSFFVNHGSLAFFALGSVVLAVTGAEALYADMGHFGRPAIARAWMLIAFPALVLNYMGQGSLLLSHPEYTDNPFYRLAPDMMLVPLIVLATMATIIASQAVISGAFSVTRQAVQLGFLPRLTVRQTSSQEIGQIYVPLVNWSLFVAIVALIIGFRSSTHLASAYGIAVTATLAIDTILFFVVVRVVWQKARWVVLLGGGAFLLIDLTFFAANTTKILHGGWVPIALAAAVFTVLSTWRTGRELALRRIAQRDIGRAELMDRIDREKPLRLPGTAVYLTALSDGMPRPLVHNLARLNAIHSEVILFTSLTRGVPVVPASKRITVTDLGHGITRLVDERGFMESPDLPRTLELARDRHLLAVDPDQVTYFLSDTLLNITDEPGLARWRKRLFAFMSRNSLHAAQFMRVPQERVVQIGTPLDI